MSNRPQTLVTEYTCGPFQAKFRYSRKEDGLVLVDAYIGPVTLEEVSLIVSFFAGKRIFWNHDSDGTLKLLLNLRVRDREDFEERFFNFLVENIPSIRKRFSIDALIEEMLAQSWIVHREVAGLEASKVLESHGRLEVYVKKTGPTAATVKAAAVLFPGSLSDSLELARRFSGSGYRVESRFPVFRAVKDMGQVPICDAARLIAQAYEEARLICLGEQ